MGCDMVVALAAATSNGQTLLAANCHRPVDEAQALRLVRGQAFAAGETVQAGTVQLPQPRQTCTVLAVQPERCWGYLQGVNECGVALAVADWQSRLKDDQAGLGSTDLVRLTLERSHSARQGLDVLTDLMLRHGQASSTPAGGVEGEGGHIYLIADGTEAFAVEAAAKAWAVQHIRHVRAASDVALIRQDWNRLAPGLADCAIAEAWWPGDGSKLDFVAALSAGPTDQAAALRRWGRMTVLVEQQSGRLDAAFLRRLLADHYEGTRCETDPWEGPTSQAPLCRHALFEAMTATAVSGVIELSRVAGRPPVYWVTLGPACLGIAFPLVLDGELPAAFGGEPPALWLRTKELLRFVGSERTRWLQLRKLLAPLQTRFEQDLDEFLGEAAILKEHAKLAELERLAGSLMQSHVERYEETAQALLWPAPQTLTIDGAHF
jgi:hypothetical protein